MNCLICIGSNYRQNEHIRFAEKRISEYFFPVYFAPEEKTEPIGLRNPAYFINQVAQFTTERNEWEVLTILKSIERETGRSFSDKQQEIVRLDIDLLSCDEKVLKPKDMQLRYVQRGIEYLHKINK